MSYLPVTESWIYSQISGESAWTSAVASLFRSDGNEYEFPASIFTDRWPFFRKGIMRSLLYRYPSIAMTWFSCKFHRGEFGALHCHFGDLGYWSLSLKKRLDIPMITMFYGYDATQLPRDNPVWKRRYRKLFETGDIFLVEGSCMKRTLTELSCPVDKIKVFHLGVDLDQIPFNAKRRQTGEPLKVLAAGAFREKKGLSYAVEAFGLARKEYPNMTLTIIGDSSGLGHEEEEKEKILSTIKQFELSDSVKLLGFQSHRRFIEELGKHDIFISPSVVARNGDSEGGSPVAITEASAAGLPVVSTRHCDIPEVVLHEKTGLLSQERDVPELTRSILLFALTPDLIFAYGRCGREHIEKEYNLKTQLRRLGDIYDDVTSLVENGDRR